MQSMSARYKYWIALFIVVLSPLMTRAGFGVSPPAIIEDHLVPGASLQKTVYLVQGKPDTAITVDVSVESKDAKEWIVFDRGTRFTIPAGVQQFPLEMTITVPANASLGRYRAFIRVTTVPDLAEESGQVAVAIGGRVDVDLTVGDDVIEEFVIKSIDIFTIGRGDPLAASVVVANTGNVPAGPNNASFELFDKYGNTRLAFVPVGPEAFPSVPAFSEKEIIVEFPLDLILAEGEYWGHVKVYDDTGTLLRDLKTVFNVGPRGTGDLHDYRRGLGTVFSTSGRGVLLWSVGGLVVLLILIGGGVWMRRRSKKTNVMDNDADMEQQTS